MINAGLASQGAIQILLWPAVHGLFPSVGVPDKGCQLLAWPVCGRLFSGGVKLCQDVSVLWASGQMVGCFAPLAYLLLGTVHAAWGPGVGLQCLRQLQEERDAGMSEEL